MSRVPGGDPAAAARWLLGRLLVSTVGGVRTSVRLREVEAYGGASDPASHAYRGETERNRTMFGPAGRLYVYRSYGMHWCANVTCGTSGGAGAVLLRAGTPEEGIDEMRRRRGRSEHLADGPGRLCQALGLTGEFDGMSLDDGPVGFEGRARPGIVTAGPRIGISRGTDLEWRFVWAPKRRSRSDVEEPLPGR